VSTCRWLSAIFAVTVFAATTCGADTKAEGDWIHLFDGNDTKGWKLRSTKITRQKFVDESGKEIPGAKTAKIDGKNVVVGKDGKEIKGAKVVSVTVDNPSGWEVHNEELQCTKPHGGNDLLTERKFADFELHVEFQATANSGVYLQGRYEIQVDNS